MTMGMDGLERIGNAVYGREPTARELIGGANARVLHDAAATIEWLEAQNKSMSDLLTQIDRAGEMTPECFTQLNEIFMGRRNGSRPVQKQPRSCRANHE